MDRDILHITIPHFPIALARSITPRLRGRPVAVAAVHSRRAVIQCVSPEARAEGVHEGLPVYRARRLCGALQVIPPDPGLTGSGARSLLKVVRHYSPLWEPAAPGRVFIDLTGSARLAGSGRDVAFRLEKEVENRLSLNGSIGVAGNKMVAGIASGRLYKPGICDVAKGSEAVFIAPLPVSALPGVGSAREQVMLSDLNLKLVGDVAALTVPQLALPFGAFAPLLHQRSCGQDPSPVRPPRRPLDVSEEATLAVEDNSDHALKAAIYLMAEGCGLRLRLSGRLAGKVLLTVFYADGAATTRTGSLAEAVDSDTALFDVADELFEKACSRRVRVKGLRLACSRLSEPGGQMDLYRRDTPGRAERLQAAMDRARTRYGMGAVKHGRTIAGGP